MLVDSTDMKVHAKFCEFRSNRSRDIRLPHFVTNGDDTSLCRSSHKGVTRFGISSYRRFVMVLLNMSIISSDVRVTVVDGQSYL